jgi:hypothetical protein
VLWARLENAGLTITVFGGYISSFYGFGRNLSTQAILTFSKGVMGYDSQSDWGGI